VRSAARAFLVGWVPAFAGTHEACSGCKQLLNALAIRINLTHSRAPAQAGAQKRPGATLLAHAAL